MNKSKTMLTGAAALVAIIAVAGVALSVSADETGNPNKGRMGAPMWGGQALTEEQREEMHEAMQSKLEAMGVDIGEMGKRMLERQANLDNREARRAEMQAKREAVAAAIEAGDYEMFKEAAGDNHPFAGQITQDNFDRFLEAHGLMEQGRAIFAELGIEKGDMGQHKGRGIMGR